jgi:hypothetical protein
MMILRIVLAEVLLCTLFGVSGPASAQSDLESKLRAFTPQGIIDASNRHTNKSGRSRDIQMPHVNADLDGNGHYDYIVAGYNVFDVGTVRVFHAVNGEIEVAGDVEGNLALGCGQMKIDLLDVDNDGKPEIVLRNSGATPDYSLYVFKWTGHSLHLMNVDHSESENSFGNADFFDLDGNGVLSIVTPSSALERTDPNNPPPPGLAPSPYVAFKLKNGQYEIAFTSPTDPTGVIGATGENQSVVGNARMRPAQFRLKQIQEAVESERLDEGDEEEGRLLVQFGNLSAPVADNPGPRSANDLELKSLVLGRNLRPLRARIVNSTEEQEDVSDHHGEPSGTKGVRFQGPFVEAQFSRQAVLRFLPRTQLGKALAPGDAVSIDVRGKMKNGAPVFGSVSVKIVGEDDGKHHDKN